MWAYLSKTETMVVTGIWNVLETDEKVWLTSFKDLRISIWVSVEIWLLLEKGFDEENVFYDK